MTQSFIQLLHPLLAEHGHGLCARLCLLPLAQRILGSHHLRPPISIWPELSVHCTTKRMHSWPMSPKRKMLSMHDRRIDLITFFIPTAMSHMFLVIAPQVPSTTQIWTSWLRVTSQSRCKWKPPSESSRTDETEKMIR